MGRNTRHNARRRAQSADPSYSGKSGSPAGSQTGSEAPYKNTRQRQPIVMADLSVQEHTCGGAASADALLGGPPYALRVRVETLRPGGIPEHLWNPRVIDDVLQMADVPAAGQIIVTSPEDFLWFSPPRQAEDGLTQCEAEDLCDRLANVGRWFRPDMLVQVNGTPVPLGVARRAARDATPRRAASVPDMGNNRKNRDDKKKKRPRRKHRRDDSSSSSEDSRAHGEGPPSDHGSDPSSDEEVDTASSYNSSRRSSHTSGSGRSRKSQKNQNNKNPHYERVPKIAGFNGDMGDKAERTYDHWRFDVRFLQRGNYDPTSLQYEVFRSLTGPPGDQVRQLGPHATVDQMIAKLDEGYGLAMTYNALAKNLHVIQQPREKTTDFEARLSRAFSILKTEFPQRYEEQNMDARKTDCFVEGLRDDLRNSIQCMAAQEPPPPYSVLLKHVRRAENMARDSSKNQPVSQPTPRSTFRKPWATVQARQSTTTAEETIEEECDSDGFDEETRAEAATIAMNAGLAAKKSFYTNRKAGETAQRSTGCWSCGKEGHFQRECPNPKNAKEGGQKGGNPPQSTSNSKAGATKAPSQ